MKRLLFVLIFLPIPAQADLAPVPAAIACANLADQDLTAIGGTCSRVTGATETTSDGIAVCLVTGTLAPQVNFQIPLPTQTWTQRYLQVGCGGLCGTITLRSGAPAMLFQVQNTLHHGWLAASNTGADGKPVLLSAKLPALHAGVLAACDGLISQPALCRFDPATLACAGAGDASCLAAAEVGVVHSLYDGPRDSSGVALTLGQSVYGSTGKAPLCPTPPTVAR